MPQKNYILQIILIKNPLKTLTSIAAKYKIVTPHDKPIIHRLIIKQAMTFMESENYLILSQASEKPSAIILYQHQEEINTKLQTDKYVKNCKKSMMDLDKHSMYVPQREKMITTWKEAYLLI